MAVGGLTSPLRESNFRWFSIGEMVNSAGSSTSGVTLAFATPAISDSAGPLAW